MTRKVPIGAPGRWREGRAVRVTPAAAESAARQLRRAIALAIAKRLAHDDIAIAELAAAIGVSQSAVDHWCRGRELPSLVRLLTIAMAIRCHLRDLIPVDMADDQVACLKPITERTA